MDSYVFKTSCGTTGFFQKEENEVSEVSEVSEVNEVSGSKRSYWKLPKLNCNPQIFKSANQLIN